MEFRVLGPLKVEGEHGPISIGPRKQRALLALLVINANRVVSTERILEALWGEDALGKERALWVHVSRLRTTLGEGRSDGDGHQILVTRDRGYALEVDDEAIDARRFERLVTEAQPHVRDEPTSAAEMLRSALDLWQGEAFEDFQYEEFASNEIDRLQALRLSATGDRFEADLRRGLAGELITELEAMQREHPTNERVVGQLMLALYRSGRPSDALRCFARLRRHLGDELGVDPSPELSSLEEQILLHDPRLQLARPADEPSPAPGDGTAGGLVEGPEPEVEPPTGPNPFRGLLAFGEEHTANFFGREQLVADIVRQLENGQGLVAVVGPSGCGKSSAVRAGVIPAVRKGAIGGSQDWVIAQMVPGADPFAELEAALLRAALDPPSSLTEQLADERVGTLRAARRILPDESSRLLLVIDQFEELFVLVDDDQRQRFLDSLIHALDDPHERVKVICTLRADFYDRPLAYHDFGRRMADGLTNVVAMAPEELEAAIDAPSSAAGVPADPALRVALVADVVGQPGSLPLLQYALTELFDRRTGPTMSLDDYRSMDGLQGALRSRADDLYQEFDPVEQGVVRQLFLRLMTVADDGEWVRRRVPATELLAIDVDPVILQSVVATYTRNRLLTTDRDHTTGSPTVEVAHESLLVEWPRLRQWIEESGDDIARQTALAAAVREWQESDQDPGYLLTGARLADYVEWADTADMLLTTAEVDLLAQSRAAEVRAEAAEQFSRDGDRRSRRRQTILATAVGAVAALGAVLVAMLSSSDGPTIALVGRPNREAGSIEDQMRNGFEQAGREYEFVAEELQPLSDAESELATLLDTSPDLVITNRAFLAENGLSVGSVAAGHRETTFAVIGDEEVVAPNVLSVQFADQEAAFLVGAAAALESRSGVIGFIGADPVTVDPLRAGYEAGARHVRPDITVLSTYLVAEAFAVWDGDLAAASAVELYDGGADVVFTAAGEGGRAVASVAAEHSERTGHHVWAVGIDVDEWLLADGPAADHILTSAIRRLDVAVQTVVERFEQDASVTGPIVLAAGNGGVSYSQSGGHLTGGTLDELEQLRLALGEGAIVVPELPTTAPTALAAPDDVVELAIDDGRCEAASRTSTSVEIGGLLRVDATNRGDAAVGIEIRKATDGATAADLARSTASMLNLGISPSAQAVVASGGDHAITARLNQSGSWAILCSVGDGTERVVAAVLEVTEPTASTNVSTSRVTYDGDSCIYEGADRFTVGQSVEFLLTNRSARVAGLSLWRVADGTTIEEVEGLDALTKVSMYAAGSVPDVPTDDSDGFVLPLTEAGTYLANCFQLGNLNGDRPGAIIIVQEDS